MAGVRIVDGSILGEKDGVVYTYEHLNNSSLRIIKPSKGALPRELAGGYSSQLDCLNAVHKYMHKCARKAEISAELKVAKANQVELEKAIRAQKAKDKRSAAEVTVKGKK